jgi:hypothetical protein
MAPATPAVKTMPKIIITQVIAAAAGRRSGVTRDAMSASNEVPLAETPAPIIANAKIPRMIPRVVHVDMTTVAFAARTAPSANMPMP